MYGMKDYAKLIYDTESWYVKAFEFAKEHYSAIPESFVLIDLSTMYDRCTYYDIFSRTLGVSFLDIIERPARMRDCESLPLYETIPFNYIDLATPILYFADTFTSLFHNHLWFKMRDIHRDMVIDRHGNILPLSLIASGDC